MMHQNIGTPVIVFNSDRSKVLLGKRKNSYKAGEYGLPGGRVEIGEKVVDAANRELMEEVGIIPDKLEFVTTIREFQGDKDFIHIVYATNSFSGTVTNTEPEKCEGWEWYPIQELPSPVLVSHAAALEAIIQNHKFIDL